MPPVREISAVEMKAIEELQNRTKKVLPPDLYEDPVFFYRYLKARSFNVDKAEQLLRTSLAWKKSFQVDTILETLELKEVFRKYFAPSILGLDKEGDVIGYYPAGRTESKDILECMKMNDHLRHIAWFTEKCFAYGKKENPKNARNPQMVLLFDLAGLTFTNATAATSAELLLGVVRLTQDNYPEQMKAVKIINAPKTYIIIYAFLQGFMSEEMRKKFTAYDKNKTKMHLLETIDEDVLPKFLGGKKTDPDGNDKCSTYVVHGGKPTADFILSKEDRYFKDGTEIKRVFVPQRTKKEIYIDVTGNKPQIHWEFMVKSRDIGFGLYHRVSEKHVEELLPLHKYCTSDGVEEGFYKCQSTGKYFIIFDNTYSWYYSKEVEYRVTVKNEN